MKEQAFQEDKFVHLDNPSNGESESEYKISHYKEELDCIQYRFVVVHSTLLEKQKLHTIEKKLIKTKETLTKKVGILFKKAFACEEDASRAILEFDKLVVNSGCSYESSINSVTKKVYSKKGRPKAEQTCTEEINFHVTINLLKNKI